MKKIVIIGSGPAAHTAAIYLARAKMAPVMYEGFYAGGVAAGGQLTTTTDVENFPGFPDGISGTELMIKMREQSVRWGTKIHTLTIDKVDLSRRPFRYWVDDGEGKEQEADVIILATGATAKKLTLPRGDILWQKGISACATCDGALPIFQDKRVVVVGGGDSACEEAHFLTRYASSVIMLVRKDSLRASQVMQDRVQDDEKISIMWNTEVVDVLGEKLLTALKIKNNQTGEETQLDCSGLFYAIGHQPNVSFLGGQIQCDETGYVIVNDRYMTSVDGVFACGDVQDKRYRQAITAAGAGCMTALEVEKYCS